jgi:hypothetical protein
MEKRAKGLGYEERKYAEHNRKERNARIVVPEDPLRDVFR